MLITRMFLINLTDPYLNYNTWVKENQTHYPTSFYFKVKDLLRYHHDPMCSVTFHTTSRYDNILLE